MGRTIVNGFVQCFGRFVERMSKPFFGKVAAVVGKLGYVFAKSVGHDTAGNFAACFAANSVTYNECAALLLRCVAIGEARILLRFALS